jgi:phage shock protein PspC (stress-responsive transcriptional regulator)
MSTPDPSGPRRLTRSRDDRIISGVCGGVARYLNVDATLVRVLMVVALVLGAFTPGLLYLVAWVLMPEQ